MAVAEKVMGLPGRVYGLAPIYVDPATAALAGGLMTLGARGDSYYEYLLKQWLLGGKRQPTLLQCVPPAQRTCGCAVDVWSSMWFFSQLFWRMKLKLKQPRQPPSVATCHSICARSGVVCADWLYPAQVEQQP